MADDETQGPEDTSWWAADAFSDSPLPAAAFDEPLVWPEALDWGPPPATDPVQQPDEDAGSDDAFGAPPAPELVPVGDAAWQPAPEPVPDAGWPASDDQPVVEPGPLAALGGGTATRAGAAPAVAPPDPPDQLDDLPTLGVTGLGAWPAWDDSDTGDQPPASIWTDEAHAVADGNLLVTSTMAAPAVYATAESNPGGRRWPRVNVRPGNVAVIALISVASLVLLGMFLSVRARNEVPTDASQSRPPGDGIAVTGTLNTVPLTTTVPTIPPSPTINLSDLIPPLETAGSTGGTGTTGTATTTVTTRPTTPSAGATTATTRPAPQSTTTTAAPEPEPTAPVGTPSTPDDLRSTVTTRPPTTSTSFTMPDIPDFSNIIPTIPRRGFSGFSAGNPNG